MRLFLACFGFGLLFSLTLSLKAATIAIPDDAETFQAALDQAEAGDTLLVSDGEYAGDANTRLVVDIPLSIMSVNGPEECIINCADNNANFAFELHQTVEIRGLTITGSIIGILSIQCNDVVVADCIIRNGTQLGLLFDACIDFRVENCSFIGIIREEVEQGAGIRLDASRGVINNCVFTDNFTGGSGAALYMNASTATLNNCSFTGNSATSYSGAVLITANSDCNVQRSVFSDNSTTDRHGGAIGVTENSHLDLTESTFSENATNQSAGAAYISSSTFSINHSVFQNNSCVRNGGAILAYNNCVGTLFNCLFISNQAGIDGGAIAITQASTVEVGNCTLTGNVAGVDRDNGMGGGLYMGSNTAPTVTNSIFWGNQSDVGPQLFAQNAGVVTVIYICAEDGCGEGDWTAQEITVENILEEEPQFEDGSEPEFFVNGFFLNADSPCLDFGEETAEELGLSDFTTQTDFAFDVEEVDLGVHYNIRWFNIVGRLFGQVTDASNDEPLGNVDIQTSMGQLARSDQDGNWEIADAFALIPFTVTATLAGYNPLTLEADPLEENGEEEINFELTHPVFAGPEQPLAGELDMGEELDIPFVITNTGNGSLTWSATPALTQDLDVAPNEFRRSLDPIENLKGAVLINGLYYLALSSDEENLIGLLSEEGEVFATFPQPGEGDGMSDLAWDGELLWGSRDNMIYGFTTDGAVIHSFQGPRNPTSGLAWDPQRGWLWACGINSPIVAYNVEGEQVGQVVNPGLRIYGLAFWQQAPLGSQLYAQSDQGNNPRQVITSINPDNGNATFVGALNPQGGGRPSSLFISSDAYPYSFTMMAVVTNIEAGRIDFWNIGLKQGWVAVAPAEGELDPGAEQELTLTLNSADFPEGAYEAELVFNHDAPGGRTIVPVIMVVIAGPEFERRTINLVRGWNLISANLQPEVAEFPALAADLVEQDALRLAKDQAGHFFSPSFDFCNMDPWSVEQAYWFKMEQGAALTLEGMTVRSDQPIALRQGWQTVSYYPRRPVSPMTAFSRLRDNLIIAKDGAGNFYSPEFQFDMIWICREGSGYQVLLGEAAEFEWSMIPNGQVHSEKIPLELPSPVYFTSPASTGIDMSLLILAPPQTQGEIGVFVGEKLVGSGVFANGRCGIPVRGDDQSTTQIEGAVTGDDLSLEYWNGLESQNLANPELLTGSLNYISDGFTVVRFGEVATPLEFGLSAVYPNPFNSMTRVQFSLTHAGLVTLTAYDVAGREIQRLVNRRLEAGPHYAAFDAEGLASGVYFLRLTSQTEGIRSVKMTCVR